MLAATPSGFVVLSTANLTRSAGAVGKVGEANPLDDPEASESQISNQNGATYGIRDVFALNQITSRIQHKEIEIPLH